MSGSRLRCRQRRKSEADPPEGPKVTLRRFSPSRSLRGDPEEEASLFRVRCNDRSTPARNRDPRFEGLIQLRRNKDRKLRASISSPCHAGLYLAERSRLRDAPRPCSRPPSTPLSEGRAALLSAGSGSEPPPEKPGRCYRTVSGLFETEQRRETHPCFLTCPSEIRPRPPESPPSVHRIPSEQPPLSSPHHSR
jgi:hypothetical protein